jgi:predicted enzyme related to lactoylglutathione lyase
MLCLESASSTHKSAGSQAMKITEIAFVVYPVADLARARQFYEGALGLVPTQIYGDESKGMVEYDIGAGTLAIGCGASQFKPSAGGGSVALEVDDFDEAVSRVRASGCKFVTEPVQTPACRIAIFSDPDGNTVMLHRRKTVS